MDINEIVVFAKDGERSETGLTKTDGFPRYEKPARQWFNSLFYSMTSKINELIVETNKLINKQDYGVGDLYLTVKAHANPAAVSAYHGYGTWQRFGEGKALVGLSTESAAPTWTKTNSETFGEYTHTLTEDEIAAHTHIIAFSPRSGIDLSLGGGDAGTSENTPSETQSSGGGEAHNNVQPSVVIEIWVRIS